VVLWHDLNLKRDPGSLGLHGEHHLAQERIVVCQLEF
jgi:hypothetical protein